MPDLAWDWLGDIHRVIPQHWAGVIVTVASILCGGLIGWERRRARKPAGLRTLVLICLGSAIFTQASILIPAAGAGDRGRIAAQVVSGVGFLGAGVIIHEGGLLIGVTTGAVIWATAAVGVVLGTGHIAAGIVFALLIFCTLAGTRVIDALGNGKCRQGRLCILFDPDEGKTRLRIQSILEEHQHEGELEFRSASDGREEVMMTYCSEHRDHHAFLGHLADLKHVIRVSQG
jgi:putative Mg2+ transporter-C (MgtC) family protein